MTVTRRSVLLGGAVSVLGGGTLLASASPALAADRTYYDQKCASNTLASEDRTSLSFARTEAYGQLFVSEKLPIYYFQLTKGNQSTDGQGGQLKIKGPLSNDRCSVFWYLTNNPKDPGKLRMKGWISGIPGGPMGASTAQQQESAGVSPPTSRELALTMGDIDKNSLARLGYYEEAEYWTASDVSGRRLLITTIGEYASSATVTSNAFEASGLTLRLNGIGGSGQAVYLPAGRRDDRPMIGAGFKEVGPNLFVLPKSKVQDSSIRKLNVPNGTPSGITFNILGMSSKAT